MFNRFELLVGLRYLRSKQKAGFVSFISLISMLGIALGVAALITVLSVMNGFQKEIRSKIIGVTSHMQIMGASGSLSDWQSVAKQSQKISPHILGYAPYVDGASLVTFDGNVSGVLVRGIDPSLENSVEDVSEHMKSGELNSLVGGKFNIIIGVGLARHLGVEVGDKITIVAPEGQVTPAGMIPRLKQFTISGIFNLHMYEYDNSLVLINIRDAQVLFKLANSNSVSGIRLKVSDIMQTHQIKKTLLDKFPEDLIVADWIDQHQNYFSAVELEKRMMFIILTLIIAVAAFNLVSTLVMTVNDKKSDIAILRTMGASKKNIMNIFIIQGGLAGVIGTVGGTILGIILALYIGDIVYLIENIFHTSIISADIYLIDYLPSQIVFKDVITIFIISIILSILATLYPSYSATKVDPVEALRHE